jgi:hypothetical protein
MKSVTRRRIGKALVPFSLRPRKKHPFRTPIPSCSIVRIRESRSKFAKEDVGRRFRVDYYSWLDGLDCIWLVDEQGKYERTVNHDFLNKNFEIQFVSPERSLYGKNRPQFGSIEKQQ